MATYEQLMGAARKAHSEGNAEHARRFLQMAKDAQQAASPRDIRPEPRSAVTRGTSPVEGALTHPHSDGSSVAPYNPSTFQRAMTGLRSSGAVPRANIRDFESIAAGGRKAVDTALFGFGDELQAAGSTITGIGGERGAFADNLNVQKARSDAAAVQNPTATNVGTVAGLAGGVAGIGKAGLTFAKNATTRWGAIKGGGMDGALYGGISGFGHTNGGLQERGNGAVAGIATGAAVGGGAAAIANLAPATAEYVRRHAGKPVSRAESRVRAAVTPETAARLDDLGDEGMLIDALGERGRALGRAAANASPEAREALLAASSARMAGQSDRLTESLLSASRLSQPATPQELAAAIRQRAKPAIDKAYGEARSLGHDIDLGAFDDIFGTDLGAKALAQGQRLASDRMVAEGIRGEPSALAVLDEAKKALDDMAAPAMGQPLNNEQAIASMLSRKLRERTDALTPEYGGARELAAGRYAQEEAVNIGAEGAKTRIAADYADRARIAAKAHPDEVAQGYASGKIDQIENRRGTPGMVDAVFGPKRQQQAMSAALGPVGANTVRSQIATERAFGETHAALSGNSTTARQLMDAGLTEGGGGIPANATATGLAVALARKGGQALVNKVAGKKREKVSAEIAKILMERGIPANALPAPMTGAQQKAREAIARALMLNATGPQFMPE
ncbi:MAG: hypothetical protein AB3N23_10905 [Paracoccaceae bacterium]